MNEVQYTELCSECDQLLLAKDSTFERVCISWLHIIREHPIFLINYKRIFQRRNVFNEQYNNISKRVTYMLSYTRQLVRALLSDGKPWYNTTELPIRPVDVLFLSHALNKSQVNIKDDHYFGCLPNNLKNKQISVVMAMINHTDMSCKKLAHAWETDVIPRVILSNSLKLKQEIGIWYRLRRESRHLNKKYKNQENKLRARIYNQASVEALSSISCVNLRMSIQIEDLVSRLRPKMIVVTYEGHSWERVVIATARRVSPKIKTVGYQHSVIFRLQHAIRRKLAPEYNPDYIMTAGEISKKQLDNRDLEGISISVLGSSRAPNFQEINSTTKKMSFDHKKKMKSTCLVIPEGIESECQFLFNFSLLCAKKFPNIYFIWRLHPVVKFEDIQRQNSNLSSLPINVLISTNSMNEDISRCRWAMYRGSTAIVQSVMSGLIPIYVEMKNEMTVDPLYELGESIKKIKKTSDLKDIFKENSNTDERKLKEYCEKIYQPYEISRLLEYVL